MSTVAEIEEAIESLPPKQIAQVVRWLETFNAETGRPLFPATRFEDASGCLNYRGPHKTDEDIRRAVTKAFSRHP